jgi:signal peptidase I
MSSFLGVSAFPVHCQAGKGCGKDRVMAECKPLKKLLSRITTVLVVAAVLLAVLLAGVRLFGLQPYTVLSGSMEPVYPTGSLLYVKAVKPEGVEVGQAITFVLNEDLVVATHRVVEIDEENQRVYTKGDANESVDGAPVHFNNLIGVPVFAIPYLGYVSHYIQNPPGLYVAIAVGAVLLLLVFLPELLAAWKKEKPEQAETGNPGAPAHDEENTA